MMYELELLKAVVDNPEKLEPRLCYAKWCEDQGDESKQQRANFIRLQIDLADMERPDGPDQYFANEKLEIAEAAALGKYGTIWADALAQWATEFRYHCGFIEKVSMTADKFLEFAPRLFEKAPILHLNVIGHKKKLNTFFDSPYLLKLRTLSFACTGFSDTNAHEMALSTFLKNIWWLDLGTNDLTLQGIRKLAASEGLRSLTFLGLDGNLHDPRERLGVEGDFIASRYLPTDGKELEKAFGTLRWLRFPTESYAGSFPNRFRRPKEYR